MPTLRLEPDGAQLRAAALSSAQIDTLSSLLDGNSQRPGVRIFGNAKLAAWLAPSGPVGSVAATHLGPRAKPVRAVLFDKRADRNWALGWHQDRTIAVREQVDTPDFANWTVKQGITHVAPPFDLLARMLTLRVHLDPVDADNAPLLVIPASHSRFWPETEIGSTVAKSKSQACLAGRGDVWLYATPILHASDAAAKLTRRRVLQIDYSADSLPGSLEWAGV